MKKEYIYINNNKSTKQNLDADHLMLVFRYIYVKHKYVPNTKSAQTLIDDKISVDNNINVDIDAIKTTDVDIVKMNDKTTSDLLEQLYDNEDSDVDYDIINDDSSKNTNTSEFQTKLKNDINTLTKEIWIDKSYVIFSENKYSNTFIPLKSWNKLVNLLKKTNYGKNATKSDKYKLQHIYSCLILTYVYNCLFLMGYNIYDIYLGIATQPFVIEFYYDGIQEWKQYPGKWQNWKTL